MLRGAPQTRGGAAVGGCRHHRPAARTTPEVLNLPPIVSPAGGMIVIDIVGQKRHLAAQFDT